LNSIDLRRGVLKSLGATPDERDELLQYDANNFYNGGSY